MSKSNSVMQRFLADESGATAIEYGLIATLLVVVIIGAMTALGGALGDLFNGNEGSIGAAIDGAVNGS
ncbi:Flp family type IVb pilin [Maritalea sp.]|uniref:Flp family type IVb pilin n=1 Tax=Maritalea sp. TaxID=2003361 RepID=UPI003EF859F9